MASVEELLDTNADSVAQLDKESTLPSELTREENVINAISTGNWDSLRSLSLLPDGFGQARVQAWQFLLNSRPPDDTGNKPDSLGALDPHKDERQVGLDTERSFVLYPVDEQVPIKSKDELKSQLHHIIVHVLRKRPKLSYFQGYHDILSVLMLTLNEDQERTMSETDQELATALNLMAEKLSLHRLRDSMGPGLEPLVGLLRLVKQLIRAVDPGYAKQLSTTSPLPYFALSNLLTYFSHDVPTLLLVQHIYDYLLSRPPIAIVYLAAVMILVRKEQVQTLFETGDEGMLHAVLCNLPKLVDDLPPETETEVVHVKEEGSSGPLSDSWHDAGAASPIDLSVSQTWTAAGSVSSQSWTAAGSTKADSIPSPGPSSPNLAPQVNPPIKQETIDSILDFPPLDPSSRPISPSPPPLDEKKSVVHRFEIQVSRHPTKKQDQQPLSLITLLKQADSLFFAHPPHTLQVSQIMGPQSVLFTWCETNSNPSSPPKPKPKPTSNPDIKSEFEKKLLDLESEKSREINNITWTIQGDLISDDMAEQMVLHPELVVRPWKDEDEMEVEREAEMARESRRKAAEEKALRKRRAKSHDSSLLGNLGGGGKGSVVVVGGVVMVVALGVVIAVYGKNGEWRKWVPRNAWLSRNAP